MSAARIAQRTAWRSNHCRFRKRKLPWKAWNRDLQRSAALDRIAAPSAPDAPDTRDVKIATIDQGAERTAALVARIARP